MNQCLKITKYEICEWMETIICLIGFVCFDFFFFFRDYESSICGWKPVSDQQITNWSVMTFWDVAAQANGSDWACPSSHNLTYVLTSGGRGRGGGAALSSPCAVKTNPLVSGSSERQQEYEETASLCSPSHWKKKKRKIVINYMNKLSKVSDLEREQKLSTMLHFLHLSVK